MVPPIACVNVATLLVARATVRQKEIAVGLSMGALRARLVRQLLTESVLLAGFGGLLGLLFAFWGSHTLALLMSEGSHPLELNVQPDARVLAFTAAVSVLTGILFGLAPALRATRVYLTPALKSRAGQHVELLLQQPDSRQRRPSARQARASTLEPRTLS